MRLTPLAILRGLFCASLLSTASYGLFRHFEGEAIAEANRSTRWRVSCHGGGLSNCDWFNPTKVRVEPDYAHVWLMTGLSMLGIVVAGALIAYFVGTRHHDR